MQVVAGCINSYASGSSHHSRSEMTHYRGAWVMMLQVPTSTRAALARQPSIANGMSRASPISFHSLRMDFMAQPWVPCFKIEYPHAPFIPRVQSFDCRACVTSPSEAGTHVITPDGTEEHLNMRHEGGHLNGHPQAQGAAHSDELSPKFVEALQSFDALHARLQASRAINETELDALESSVGGMEAVMSSTSPHEYWHMGSAWLKLTWLYSDAADAVKEFLSRVIASGNQALKFLEALQTPIWTIVSCHYVLGHAHMKIEKFQDAVYHLEKAVSMVKDLEFKGPPNSEQTQLVNAVHSLSRDTKIRFGRYLCSQVREYLLGNGDPQLFLSTITEALELVKEKPADRDPLTIAAELENCLGIFYLQSQQASEALPHFKNSLATLTKLHGANNIKLATAHNHLGVAYTDQCKLSDALKHFESAKRILSKCTPLKGDGTEVTLYNNIAQVYALRGRFDDAITAQKRLIELIKQNMKDNIQTPFLLEPAEETLQEMYEQLNAR